MNSITQKAFERVLELSEKRGWYKSDILLYRYHLSKCEHVRYKGEETIRIQSFALKEFHRLYYEENKYLHQIIKMMVDVILFYNKDLKWSGVNIDLIYIDRDTEEENNFRMQL